MSRVEVRWGNEAHSIMIWDFEKGWTWNDLNNARRTFDQLMDTVPHTVHIIFNMNRTILPIGDAMHNLKTMNEQYPPNMGLLIVVNPSSFAFKITNIVKRVFRIWNGMTFVSTLAEAYDHISEQTPN